MTPEMANAALSDPVWRDDIDALQFAVIGGAEAAPCLCFIHRLAFRRLLGATPDKDACLEWFERHRDVFLAAALAKRATVMPDGRACNFHINSRDVSRRLHAARSDQAID